MSKKTNNHDDRMPLGAALKALKAKYPWAPLQALRKAVASGRVPTVRSSTAPKARYYVRLDELEQLLLQTQSR
jgi:hypothetical protein